MSIKTIWFDYGNVIDTLDNSRTLEMLARHSTLPLAELERTFFGSALFNDYEKGKISSEDFFEQIKERAQLDIDERTYLDYCRLRFLPNRRVHRIIEGLHTRGYRLLLVSNTNPRDFEHTLRQSPVFPFFSYRVLSYEVGHFKEEGFEMFASALAYSNCPKEQCLHIDEGVDIIENAGNFGVNAYQFTTNSGLSDFLGTLGLF